MKNLLLCKIVKSIILFILLIFTLVSCGTKEEPEKQVSTENEQLTRKPFIYEDLGVKITSIQNTNEEYEGFKIEFDGKEKEFDWKCAIYDAYVPEIILFHHDEYLLFRTTLGGGTALCLEEAHIIDLTTMNEITVENPINYIEKNITSVIDNGKATVYFNGEIIGEDKIPDGLDTNNLFDTIGFGNIIKYRIENELLYVKIFSLVTPGCLFGNLEFVYQENIQDNIFKINEVNYINYASVVYP